MAIETITHAMQTWPSGLSTILDPVQSAADRIGRQEVSVYGAIDAQDQMMVYAYLDGQDDFGLDPWRYLDGIDHYRNEDKVDVWFESGACKTLPLADCPIRFFVDAKNLEAAGATQ